MTDGDGVTISVGSAVWFDDGHSADWQHGSVTGFPSTPANSASIHPDGGGNNLVVGLPLVHVNKPKDPPDH